MAKPSKATGIDPEARARRIAPAPDDCCGEDNLLRCQLCPKSARYWRNLVPPDEPRRGFDERGAFLPVEPVDPAPEW